MARKSKNTANRKRGTKSSKGNQARSGNFTLTCHMLTALSVPSGGVREVQIAPTLSLFSRAV